MQAYMIGRIAMEHEEPTGRAKGGIARARSLTPQQRSEIASRASRARHGRPLLKATHPGTLEIAGAKVACYVLEDGTRILSQRGLNDAFGITHGGAHDRGQKLPRFLGPKALEPFISKELTAGLHTPIRFTPPHGGNPVLGAPATLLPDVCNVWLRAREAKALDGNKRLEDIAQQAEIIVRGLAHIGIIALVDEATGYQRDRAKDALARILEQFIAKELQPYVPTFPAEYYEQIFRLRGLEYPGGSVRRPQYFGILTNDIIYKRLAPGVLEELKRVTPRDEMGRHKDKLFRRLTSNTGYPKLRELLGSVITIMDFSANWKEFMGKLDKRHPKYGGQLKLPLEYQEDKDTGEGI